MKSNRILIAVLTVLFSAAVISPVYAKKDMPPVNDEGMVLVKNSDLATVYTDPDADLGIYKRIQLEDATVAFKKNWKRDQNRGNSLKVRDSDMDKIKSEVATMFRQILTDELLAGGYEMAEEPGEDVLKVVPAIIDLDITAPDIPSSSFNRTYSESAGEMTLNLELYDSVTNDKIAKATDRQEDWRKGYLQWRTSVSNRADARRMMTTWAKALRSALDEARSSPQHSE